MKKYPQVQRSISITVIFCLLIQISGCVGSKLVATTDLPVSGNYNYRIHGQKSNYMLENVVISDGLLSGKLNMAKSSQVGKVVNIYLISDSTLKIEPGQILSIPLSSISKAEKKDFSIVNTIIFAGTIFLAASLLIFFSGTMGGMNLGGV